MSQRILCETCRKVREQGRYNAIPREKRDGKAMLYSGALDRYCDSPDARTQYPLGR
ncbi:hypothetical protein [Nitrosomonas sp.]|uniref:hypothetical protein n=1 Tax=Nitrosomonas sp. TaxID=42353 RepID=UPI0025F61E9C|nr:hypothetical protein [Nitrosomonas sp.]MCC6916106.1 hypothetical protein [Nitrosomonas sp.]